MSYPGQEEDDDVEMRELLVEAQEFNSNNNSRDCDENGTDGDESSHIEERVTALSILLALGVGIFSSSPTIALVGLGSGHVLHLLAYTVLLWSTAVPAWYLRHKSGILRWFVGFLCIVILSGYKSGILLQNCNNMAVKAVLYAITALWECSNAVLILGGNELVFKRFGIKDFHSALLYASAPCQVQFVSSLQQGHQDTHHTIGKAPNCRRSLHISLCLLGLGLIYFLLDRVEPIRTLITSFVILELECLAIMTSLAVVLFDLPSHLWQCIHDFVIPHPFGFSVKAVLPYGWIYSSTSTRQFWSRWSRPATQFIRHLFFYPLGGRQRWYLSVPIMFLLNASSHYDLSFALTGDRAEIWWNLVFGTLAIAAMMEIVGDSYYSSSDSDSQNHPVIPKWYTWTRVILVHISLRVALYFMIHKCLKTSLNDILG